MGGAVLFYAKCGESYHGLDDRSDGQPVVHVVGHEAVGHALDRDAVAQAVGRVGQRVEARHARAVGALGAQAHGDVLAWGEAGDTAGALGQRIGVKGGELGGRVFMIWHRRVGESSSV